MWVRHMESKKEAVTGPMLVAKRRKFEDLLNVPLNEQLKSEGWVWKFCKSYIDALNLHKPQNTNQKHHNWAVVRPDMSR